MKLIAQIPGWSLYDRLSPSGGWISLKLVASGKLPKRHWWLGFNGTRMSRTAMPSSSSSTNPISMRGSSIRCQDWRDTQIWRETPHPTATEYVPDAVAAERIRAVFATPRRPVLPELHGRPVRGRWRGDWWRQRPDVTDEGGQIGRTCCCCGLLGLNGHVVVFSSRQDAPEAPQFHAAGLRSPRVKHM